MSATSLLTIAALLIVAFALWFIVYRIIWSPFSVLFYLQEGGAEEEAAGYNSYAERVSIVIFTDVWITAGFLWGLIIEGYYTVRDNPQVFIGLFLVMGASIVVATFDSEILEAIDEVWHDVIFAAYEDVVRPLLVAFRDLFNVLIPWYNLFVAAVPDTIIFTVELFVKCDLATWQESIDAFANIFVVLAQEISIWIIRIVENNGASFNFFRLIKTILVFLETLIDKIGCLCYELSWLWCTIFDILNSDNLAISIDQFLNFFLCMLDIIIDWIIALITLNFNQNPIPDFAPAFDKVCNSTKAFGDWISDIVQIVVQEFITDENVIPNFGCLIGDPLCAAVRIVQAGFDLLANEYQVIRDIENNRDINFLLDDYDYQFIFAEFLSFGQCVDDVFSFWNVKLLNLVGCTLQNLIDFVTYLIKLPVDWTFELFAIGPTCFTDLPTSLEDCADTYLEFAQNYNYTVILDSARNSSFCFFGILGLVNEDFACAGDNITNAVINVVNITLEMVLHPDLVFTSSTFWSGLPFDETFVYVENFFMCLGNLLKSFASDPNGCPPHVVDFQSGNDDDDDEQVNFWCCTGNTVEGLGKALVALAETLFNVLLDIIEDESVEQLAQNAFDTFSFVVVPNLEIGLDNLACIPLAIFEELECPSGGFSNFDDDDDDAHTMVGEALEAWTIEFINITLIPAKLIEVSLGAFLAGYDEGGDCDSDCKKMLNEVVCPGIDIDSSSQGLEGCILVGFANSLFVPFINYLQGVGAVGGCFFGHSVQTFFRGAAAVLSSLVNFFDTKVLPIFECTFDFWSDVFRGKWSSLPNDVKTCWDDMENFVTDLIKIVVKSLGKDFLCAILGNVICDIVKRDVEESDHLIPIEKFIRQDDWTGDTRCDRIVQSYETYIGLGLEGVARAEISNCIILRRLARSVNSLSPWDDTPLVEEDVLYNPIRMVRFLHDLPKGIQAFGEWKHTVQYMKAHQDTWKDAWESNHTHITAEIKDLDFYLVQQGVKSQGVITLVNGVTDSLNRIINMLVRARSPDEKRAEGMFDNYKQKVLDQSTKRMQQQALKHTTTRAVQRQQQFSKSRTEFSEKSIQFVTSIRENITEFLRPKTAHAIQRRAQASKFVKRMKQAYQVSFIDRYPVEPRIELRDTCKFPGDSCNTAAECCTGLVCVEHSGSKGKICSTDVCARLFDDDDDDSRFDCEDVCEFQCTGCNWLQDVFCVVYLQRFSEVLFRIDTGQVPCLNESSFATPTPTPTPIINKIPEKSFVWQVFTWITRNIFGISDHTLIDTINDVGNFVINTNVDPDDGSVGLVGTIVGFFFCEYSELSACSGPGIQKGLEIITPIYLLTTVIMSFVFPASSWLLDIVWMTYIPVLQVVSYEVGYLCYLRTLPFPNLPENLANDLLSFFDSVFTPFLNWNAILPGLLMIMGGVRTFKSCSQLVGFVNWSDNLVFLLQWQLPSVANFFRDTDYFALRWIRELPFLGDSFSKPQFMFTGTPPDAELSCFYYTSLNWSGLLFVTALAALFILFSVLLSYLIAITILAIFTWIAYLGIETARKTRTARRT